MKKVKLVKIGDYNLYTFSDGKNEYKKNIFFEDFKPSVGDILFFPNKVLEEMKRVLKKDGDIYLVENDIGGEFEKIRNRYPDTKRTKEYNDWIENNGFICKNRFETYFKFKSLIEYPKLGAGSTFAEFKIFILKDMDIIIPPIILQNEFAEFVELIDKSKFVCHSKYFL